MRDLLNYFTYYSSYPFRSIFAYIPSSLFLSFLSLRVVRHSETHSMGQNRGQNPYAFSAVIDQFNKADSKIISSYYIYIILTSISFAKILYIFYFNYCRDTFFHSFNVKSYNLKITIVEILPTSPFNQFGVIISNIVSTGT